MAYNYQPLDFLPLWALFMLTALFLFLALEAGYRLGKVVQQHWPDKSEKSVGTMVGAALALLGFLLAFVTSLAIGVFNDRRQLVISEANAIGTTYLRAGYLEEPYGTESRRLLVEYVNLRLDALNPSKTVADIARSELIHDELWARAEKIARENPGPTIALYISSLNEVIDLHTKRLNEELGFRVPPIILLGLYVVALLTMMLIGVHNSYSEQRNLVSLIMVVLIISVVFLVIFELDRSNVGLLRTPQKALLDLQLRLNSGP
jgi:hypothetical protein